MRLPLEAVIVMVVRPGTVVETASTDEPELLSVEGLKRQEPIPEIASHSDTVPVNPFWKVTVAVKVAGSPWFTVRDPGVTDNVKFCTDKLTAMLCTTLPLAPVIISE